jgi:hypothetical protein
VTPLLLLGCVSSLDPSDCAYFEDCSRWRPAGLVIGLAHEGDDATQQMGSSARGADGTLFDPARQPLSSGTISARAADAPCPAGAEQAGLFDHEGGDAGVDTCVSDETSTVPEHSDDLPRGAVCGLSNFEGADHRCGATVSPGRDLECPDDTWTLHWIPDYYIDHVDSTCESTDDGTGPLVPAFDIDVYCSRDGAGCEDGACADDVVNAGVVCGLHEMVTPDSFLDGTSAPADLGAGLDQLFRSCPDHPLLAEADILREAAAAPVECMGVDVSNGQDCPAGLITVCTWDQVSSGVLESFDSIGNIADTAWCWCASPDLAQGTAAPLSRDGT